MKKIGEFNSKNKLQILNPSDMDVQVKGALSNLEQIQKALKEVGMYSKTNNIKINVTGFDETSQKIKNFIVQVKEANGIMKEFKFDRGLIPDKVGNINLAGYTGELTKITDTTDKVTTKLEEFKSKYNEILEGFKSFNILPSSEVNRVKEALNALTTNANKVNFDNIKSQVKQLETSMNSIKSSQGLGMNLGAGTGLNLTSSIEQIERYIQSLHNGQAAIQGFTNTMDSNGNKIKTVNYSVNEGNGYIGKYKLNIDGTTNSVFQLERGFTAVNEKTQGFGSALKDSLSSITGISVGIMAIYKAIEEFKKGIETVIDMESTLATVSMTMSTSKQQLQDLSNAAQQTAINMSTSVENVTDAIRIYANETENVQSILQKVKGDITLSNIAGMKTSETTNTLQAILNQFGLKSSDTDHVVDALASISSNMKMDFGQGIQEISRGIMASGSVAKDANMSLEEYSSILGKIIETSRLSGSQVGTGVRSIFSRMLRVKKGESLDENGGDISKTEQTLRSQGIELRDSAKEFKPMDEILKSIAERFKTASSAEKSLIADSAAGINQRNVFINMINSYSEAIGLTTKALNSNGVAEEMNQKYLETSKAKIESLKATVESMWLKLINSQDIGKFVDDIKGVVEGISNISQHLGLFTTIVTTASTALIGFNKNLQIIQSNNGKLGLSKNAAAEVERVTQAYKKNLEVIQTANNTLGKTPTALEATGAGLRALTASTIAQTVASTALNMAIGMGVGLLISLAVEGVMKLVNAQNDLANNNKELQESVANNIQNNKFNMESLQGIKKDYEDLKDKTNLSTEEQKRWNEIAEEIAGINKEATLSYDSHGKAILNMKGNVDDLIKSLKEKNQLENMKLENGL